MKTIKKISLGIFLFIIEIVIYSHIHGHALYLLKSLAKLEWIEYNYIIVTSAGMILYFVINYFELKINELSTFIKENVK